MHRKQVSTVIQIVTYKLTLSLIGSFKIEHVLKRWSFYENITQHTACAKIAGDKDGDIVSKIVLYNLNQCHNKNI